MEQNLSSLHRQFRLITTACGLFLMTASAFAQHTYYISQSTGSDSNTSTQAQSKSTPWAHLPGMINCAANCASYSPVAGDRFILKGGDTWGTASLRVTWRWSGTAANRIYIGVDQTWFAGASWTRPILNCQNTQCGADNVIWLPANYVTFDNIEITGWQNGGGGGANGGKLVWVYGNNDEIENFYIHGFSRNTSAAIVNSYAITADFSGPGVKGASFHDNVIDGSDSPNQDFMGGILHGDKVYNNVIRYVYNGFLGIANDIHSNLVEHNYESPTGDHCNGIFNFAPMYGTSIYMYNNVVRHTSSNGCVNFWINGNNGPNSSIVGYVFNNLLYDLNTGNVLNIGAHDAGSYGTYYVFNNTVECGNDNNNCGWPSNWNGGPYYTGNFANNHWIASSQYYCPVGSTCTFKTELVQGIAQAKNIGYNASGTYAFSPANSSSSTVGQGTNVQSYCTSLSALDVGAATACQSDTTYPEYDAVNHKVVLRTTNGRGSVWDKGAYQYSSSPVLSVVYPPNGVVATVR